MSVDDFVEEFETLYICRVFKNNKKWASNPPIEGEWKGLTS